MARMKTMVEASWEDEDGSHKVNYFLLHWGLKYDMVPDAYDNMIPVQYTIGICQHVETGVIEMFTPEQLKVLGTNLKEEE